MISLEDHVVASSYDPLTGVCRYVVRHIDGNLYTVEVPLQHFEKHPPSRQPGDAAALARRNVLTQAIEARLKLPPDKPLQIPPLDAAAPTGLKPPGLQRKAP